MRRGDAGAGGGGAWNVGAGRRGAGWGTEYDDSCVGTDTELAMATLLGW